eukprot:2637952-Prymnesium_polylepis.1
MHAAYATGGGTSALLVKAIEDKCFARHAAATSSVAGSPNASRCTRTTSGRAQTRRAAGCSGSAAPVRSRAT